MNNTDTPKFPHDFISYILLATLPIQICLIALGICSVYDGATSVCAVFFIEGIYIYIKGGYITNDGIYIRHGFGKTTVWLFKDVIDVKLNGVFFDLIASDGSKKQVGISPRLCKSLAAHHIPVPNLRDITLIKAKDSSFNTLLYIQMMLLCLIWKNYASISRFSVLSIVFTIMCCTLGAVLLYQSSARVIYDKGVLKVRGFFRVNQTINLEHVTLIQKRKLGIISVYSAFVNKKRIMTVTNFMNLGAIFALAQQKGVKLQLSDEV